MSTSSSQAQPSWWEAARLVLSTGRWGRRRLRRAQRFLADRARFIALGGQIAAERALLDDADEGAGSSSGHYFHQDLLVASAVFQAHPQCHVDVGSRIDGFVAHVASFRPIEVFDIRPLPKSIHPNIRFVQGDLMNTAAVPANLCDSLSCLHALEHFGLGRYGDPIDPEGHRKGFASLSRMLRPGGTLYLGVPIGRSAVHFNAHRVFAPEEPLTWAAGAFDLVAFSHVDDSGDLQLAGDPLRLPPLEYGCGIYTFRKRPL